MEYHLKINLGHYSEASDDTLRELMGRDDGGPECSPAAARALIQSWQEQGLSMGPPCDHQDDAGNCLGHHVLGD